MSVENGEWVMHGIDWSHPDCIHTVEELENYIEECGFLPLFANEIPGFSVEERTDPVYWWTGIEDRDPWTWREIIARRHKVAYGKFFDKRAGFISLKWLPVFANARRCGYDFDAGWEDGRASYREKKIMDFYMEDGDSGILWKDVDILSSELKVKAGFGKGGEKNFPGITTGLQMQTYLVTSDFRRKKNKKGEEYGMAVAIYLPPETIWGYKEVTKNYKESPDASWEKIYGYLKDRFTNIEDGDIIKVIGKKQNYK